VILIEALAEYVETSFVYSELQSAAERVGRRDLHFAAARILNWLKIQYRWKKRTVLRLEKVGTGAVVRLLVRTEPVFQSILELHENCVDLRESISEEEREHILELADKLYNPITRE
jgi:hypothetical protein